MSSKSGKASPTQEGRQWKRERQASGSSSRRHLFAPMRKRQVEHRPERNEARWVNRVVSDVVVALDMIEINRLRDARLLIKIHQITLEAGIIDDAPKVTFEVEIINDIEPNECAEKPPVRFHDPVTEEIPAIR